MGSALLLTVCAVLLHYTAAQSCTTGCARSKTYYLKHYDELGCTPSYSGGSCCPASYNCDQLMKRPNDKCRYKDTDISVGLQLYPNYDLPCKTCSCYNTTRGPHFLCNTKRCPTYHLPPNCVEVFNFKTCCAEAVECRRSNTTTYEPPTPAFTCKYNEKTYFEGEVIPSGEPCKSCLCQKGFNGSMTGPWCRVNSCGLELTYSETFKQGCVPVYYKDPAACCPLRWRCPSANDYVIPASKPSTAVPTLPSTVVLPLNGTVPMATIKPTAAGAVTTRATTVKAAAEAVAATTAGRRRRAARQLPAEADPMTQKPPPAAAATPAATAPTEKTPNAPAAAAPGALTCKFGTLTLQLNDKLAASSNKCIECSCLVPPYVTCLTDPRCSPWQ